MSLLGVKRTFLIRFLMSADDPKRTLELSPDPHPSMGRRERRDEGLEMTYRGHRQHQQPTSDDKTSADYARHEMSPDGFLHEHKRRNSRHPEHVHHATNEQQRHQNPTASNT